jgi:hypothetical protein
VQKSGHTGHPSNTTSLFAFKVKEYVCVCVCVCVCVYVCMYVCLCMYVCMYVLCKDICNVHMKSKQIKCQTATTKAHSCASPFQRFLNFIPLYMMEPGSSGSIVSDYGLGDRGSIPGRGKGFFV